MTTRRAHGVIAVDPAKVDQFPPGDKATPDQITQARACVERLIPEGQHRDEVMDALFNPGRPQRPSRPPTPPERIAFLARARTWLLEQGYTLIGNKVAPRLEQLYSDATGDRWVP